MKNIVIALFGYISITGSLLSMDFDNFLKESQISNKDLFQVHDRNNTRVLGKDDEPIHWLENKFAELNKNGINLIVKTNIIDNGGLVESMRLPTLENKNITVTLNVGTGIKGAEKTNLLWSQLVGQITLIDNLNDISNLKNKAINSEIGKEDFADGISKIYFDASIRVKDFYHKTWIVWCKKSGNLPASSAPWFGHAPSSFEEWNQIQKRTGAHDSWSKIAEDIKK